MILWKTAQISSFVTAYDFLINCNAHYNTLKNNFLQKIKTSKDIEQ